MAAKLTRPESVGFLRVGHDAAAVREAHAQTNNCCRAENRATEHLGQVGSAAHSEGSDGIQKTSPGVHNSQWGPFRTPALLAVFSIAAIHQTVLFRATQSIKLIS